MYPNVIAVERQLRVAPSDFRLWVCLHEVTHRVQFTANPWLPDYMSQRAGAVDPGRRRRHRAGGRAGSPSSSATAVTQAIRRTSASGILGLVRAVQSEPQRKALDQLLVLGTLLEGHADHVMDAVGPMVVPSVATIRRRFDERRQRKQPPLQRLLRALLGLDAKLSQYTRGKAFVDHVVGRVGMERFNTDLDGPRDAAAARRDRRPAAMDRQGAVGAAAHGCRDVRQDLSAPPPTAGVWRCPAARTRWR